MAIKPARSASEEAANFQSSLARRAGFQKRITQWPRAILSLKPLAISAGARFRRRGWLHRVGRAKSDA